ncbi:hypothetical protein MAR_011487 [Mya arenaria]|uniref:Uncharacterized protein n=1 Tax=Mya arenaria TaxID=6604 RepID=A0ABY7FU85_MYAAR|nr:hypothetical protein MAR_011487 [Mya arenaria]
MATIFEVNWWSVLWSVPRSLVSQSATDLSNLGKVITAHMKCKTNADSLEAAEHFTAVMSGTKKNTFQSVSCAHDLLVNKNRQILKGIIETIILCGQQNLAGGHEDTDINVEPSHPRAYNNRSQKHRQNSPADTISEYWRRNLYIPFVDHLSMDLSDRLIEDGDRFNAQYLISSEIGHLNDVIVQSIYVTFERDLPAESLEEFQREVCRWRNRCDSDGLVYNNIGALSLNVRADIFDSNCCQRAGKNIENKEGHQLKIIESSMT